MPLYIDSVRPLLGRFLEVDPIVGSGWVRRVSDASLEDMQAPDGFGFRLDDLYLQDDFCYGLLGVVNTNGSIFYGMSVGAFVRRDELVSFGVGRCSYNLLISLTPPEILAKWPIANPALIKASTFPYYRGSVGSIRLRV